MVGAPIAGRRVLIVDDVITAGTAIREAVDILARASALLVGVAVALDRQEMVSETVRESAIQQVEREFAVPVTAIVRLKHLVRFVRESSIEGGTGVEVIAGTRSSDSSASVVGDKRKLCSDEELTKIEEYRTNYGVDY